LDSPFSEKLVATLSAFEKENMTWVISAYKFGVIRSKGKTGARNPSRKIKGLKLAHGKGNPDMASRLWRRRHSLYQKEFGTDIMT
jgi:hypothetical protein